MRIFVVVVFVEAQSEATMQKKLPALVGQWHHLSLLEACQSSALGAAQEVKRGCGKSGMPSKVRWMKLNHLRAVEIIVLFYNSS